jgi:hypothetical protein
MAELTAPEALRQLAAHQHNPRRPAITSSDLAVKIHAVELRALANSFEVFHQWPLWFSPAEKALITYYLQTRGVTVP